QSPAPGKRVPADDRWGSEPATSMAGEVVGSAEWHRPFSAPAPPPRGVIQASGRSPGPLRTVAAREVNNKEEQMPQPRRSAMEPDGMPQAGPGMEQPPFGPVGHEDPVPRELRKVTLPPYVIEAPDILLVEAPALKDQPVRGQHLVRPDGTINVGIYGS